MKSEFEYACSNGKTIVSEPGTLEAAQATLRRNWDAAFRAGDESRHDYHIVKRRVRRGRWLKTD